MSRDTNGHRTINLWGYEAPIGLVIVVIVFVFASGNGATVIQMITNGSFSQDSGAKLFTPDELREEVDRLNRDDYIDESVEANKKNIAEIVVVQEKQGTQLNEVQEIVQEIAETVGANSGG